MWCVCVCAYVCGGGVVGLPITRIVKNVIISIDGIIHPVNYEPDTQDFECVHICMCVPTMPSSNTG